MPKRPSALKEATAFSSIRVIRMGVDLKLNSMKDAQVGKMLSVYRGICMSISRTAVPS